MCIRDRFKAKCNNNRVTRPFLRDAGGWPETYGSGLILMMNCLVCAQVWHMLWSYVDGAHTFLVSKPSGISAPASAYLRAVPNSVAGFVYTERGKSHCQLHCHHSTHTHNNMYAHMHRRTHNSHTALCKSTTTDMELSWTYAQTSAVKKTQMWSDTFLWHFSA